MDYTQRHYAECADVKQSGDENQDIDVVLLIPNFSLMERFFANGEKDPWFFYKKIKETIYPPHKIRKQNDEWQEESKRLFRLKKRKHVIR